MPKEARRRERLNCQIQSLFEERGYAPIETPTLESMRVMDQGGHVPGNPIKLFDAAGDLLAMRPDVTLQIARMCATRLADQEGPFRFRYSQRVFREAAGQTAENRVSTQIGLECIRLCRAKDGRQYCIDDQGEVWRAYDFISGGISLDMPRDRNDFYQAAVAFGKFQQALADFPAASLYETIPHFHDTIDRLRQFRAAIEADVCGRVKDVGPEIDFLLAREQELGTLCRMLAAGELPLRVTHNDTKLNNVLLDPQTGCAKCVLDLDTVMPGLSAYDFGDGVRFGASSAAEDEKDLDQVWLKLDMYQAFLEGYLDACGHALTPKEIEVLPLGAKIITAELAMRFLKDYLDGDVYFKIDYPTQNLDRCRTQLKLVADMEAKWPEMQRILHETAAVRCAQPTTPQ